MLATLLLLALSAPAPTPLTVHVGEPSCPDRTVEVMIGNPDATRDQPYTLYAGGVFQRHELVPAGTQVMSTAIIAANAPTDITVTGDSGPVATYRRTAECGKGKTSAAAAPAATSATQAAESGGPGPGGILLGALAVLLALGVLLFYAFLWPRSGNGDWSSPVRRTR